MYNIFIIKVLNYYLVYQEQLIIYTINLCTFYKKNKN